MQEILSSTLDELGEPVKVTLAATGFEAVRCLARASFDLIVTDINMPDINGLEFVSFVKGEDEHRTIPLIIVSTEGSTRDRERGMELGADAYLAKPFDPEELLDLARGLIADSPRAT